VSRKIRKYRSRSSLSDKIPFIPFVLRSITGLYGSGGIDGIARLYGQACSCSQRSPASSCHPRCGSVFFRIKRKMFFRATRQTLYRVPSVAPWMSVRIKDKYSWLPAVPGVAFVRPVGSNLMEYTIEEVRHGTRSEPLSISRLETRRIP